MADLHVLEDLGDRQADRAEDPERRQGRPEQDGARAELELALHVDDLADVGRVLLAPAVEDLLADRVELDAELLDVLGGEVRDRVDGLLGDDGHGDSSGLGEVAVQWSRCALAGGGVDAGLDRHAGRAGLARDGGGDRAVAQVADRARPEREHAAHADAHPAAAGHQDTGLLGDVEQRLAAVGLEHGAVGERERPTLARLEEHGAEPLGGERESPLGVVLLEGVEQSGRAAGVGQSVVEVGHQPRQVRHVQHPVRLVVPLDERDPPGVVVRAELVAEDRRGLVDVDVHQHDVGRHRRTAGEEVAQHPDHRGDAGPGGDEEQLVGSGCGSTNSPSACSSWIISPTRARWTR